MAKQCKAGEILRKGYTIKSGPAKGTRVTPSCVPDKGAPGKGPKTLPKPRAGALHGYSTKLSAEERREVLNRLARKDGCGVVVKRLNLIANFTKRSNPSAHKTMRADMKYMQEDSRVCKVQIKRGEYTG